MGVGSAFPTVDRLRTETGLSRNTIVASLRELSRQGYIKRGPSRRHGYHVARTAPAPGRPAPPQGLRPVSVILPFESWNYVAAKLLQALESACATWNTRLIFHSNANAIEREGELLEAVLRDQRPSIGALVLMTCRSFDHPHLELLRQIRARCPLILLDRYIRGLSAHYVGAHNRAIGYRAARHLIEKGRKRIAFAGAMTANSTSYDRWAGCLCAVREAGLRLCGGGTPRRRYPRTLQEVREIGKATARRLLQRAEKPDGIVCENDFVAFAVRGALTEKRLRPGKDVLITGCDHNQDQIQTSGVIFTGFEYPFRPIAQEITFLIRRLRSTPELPHRNTEFEAAFVEGNTASPR
jgi:DNA-binding LacI/PurR family transcriptional regulator